MARVSNNIVGAIVHTPLVRLIVTVIHRASERYLSTDLFAEFREEQDVPVVRHEL